jgi:PHD/YefM family antitoxin component YafN of YafNO toxin-antitoxin module
MASQAFQSLDLNVVRSALERLADQVIRGHGRVEITRDGWEESCVLISKTELDGIERALEIFAESESGADMRRSLMQVAQSVSSRSIAAAT